jgi:hypothetical protein
MSEIDYQTQMSINNLLQQNRQLHADLIRFKPEVSVKYDEDTETVISTLTLNGKTSTTTLSRSDLGYYDIKAQAGEIAADLSFTYELLLREMVLTDLEVINANFNNFGV